MRFLKHFVFLSGSIVIVAIASLWFAVRASLPQLDGDLSVSGLGESAHVVRDAIGVVTIRAASRRDAALATGFAHAQDRFFQMDLMRRLAAGELAAVVGEAAADYDARQRVHRMRHVARDVLEAASDAEREVVEAYAIGVNAGLRSLTVRPFEYLLLRAEPSEWRAEDTVLVVLAMYFRLHDERAERESNLGRLRDALPPEMFDFLTQAGTTWDAPLLGGPLHSLPVPDARVCDVGRAVQPDLVRARRVRPSMQEASAPVGSNAWAVSPRRTREGVAMLANDMHLGLAVPNTWFRLRLVIEDASLRDEHLDVSGVSLPGTPAMVAGSNGSTAWGFTNTYGDWVDLVELEIDPEDPQRYRTADGFRTFGEHTEVIQVRGAEPRTITVRSTVWGPVIEVDSRGRSRALRWLAHDPQATNFSLLAMERARNVHEAMDIANRSGIPPQNVILADRDGHIAWTVMGRIPQRAGYDPRLPSSWAEPGRGWFGWLPANDYPRILDPSTGALWSANTRALDGPALDAIGDGGFALGARATQIRDALLSLENATEAAMLAIQLDDRALFLSRWRRLMLDVLASGAATDEPRRARARQVVESGGHNAAVDDAGYRLVRNFRREVARRAWAMILAGCARPDGGKLPSGMRQWEGALWRIIEERPTHLLGSGYADWQEFLLAAADAAVRDCGDKALERCTWGRANVLNMRHPLGRAAPLLAAWLDMPASPMPGDLNVPRVQAPAIGASQRFAVIPGREESGYFHMPGGQSGHPMSPFYDAGHRDWAEGEPTPFLPGPDRHRLTLKPVD